MSEDDTPLPEKGASPGNNSASTDEAVTGLNATKPANVSPAVNGIEHGIERAPEGEGGGRRQREG